MRPCVRCNYETVITVNIVKQSVVTNKRQLNLSVILRVTKFDRNNYWDKIFTVLQKY